MRVMTYNIHSGVGIDGVLDLGRIAGVIEAAQPDLVALQEVDRHRREQSGFADQPGWLAQRLGLHLAYSANLDQDPEAPGRPRRQYGTALLSRVPLREWANEPLPCFPGSEQSGPLDAVVDVGATRLRVLGTHLQHDRDDERLAQAEAIRARLDGQPTILLGDLNAPPDSAAYTALSQVFEDAWTVAGEGPGITFDAEPPPRRIDYVLCRNGIRALAAWTVASPASDHAALVVEIALDG
jgi:endonuclease/exonuclease/phosphatase family metal-dependent hydrolase